MIGSVARALVLLLGIFTSASALSGCFFDTDDDDVILCPSGRRPNACGGCGEIPQDIGEVCGQCSGDTWTCNPINPNEAQCLGDSVNECGGCEKLYERPGAQCGRCSGGSWTCSADNDSLECIGDRVNACGGCRDLFNDNEPEDPCGRCGNGVWVCDTPEVMTCRGAGVNECGGCVELGGEVGDACGECGFLACNPNDDEDLLCVEELNECGGCGQLDG